MTCRPRHHRHITRRRAREEQAILNAVAREACNLGRDAAEQAGLDANTSDAVGHATAARIVDGLVDGIDITSVIAEEIQRHAAP